MSDAVLGFYGDDRTKAWRDALDLADKIVGYGAADRLAVRAEKQRGEWVVVLSDVIPGQRRS